MPIVRTQKYKIAGVIADRTSPSIGPERGDAVPEEGGHHMCLGVIGVVTRTFAEGEVPMADVDNGDGPRAVCLLYCPEAAVGDDVLVHMGFVMEVLDPARAAESRALRRLLVEGDDADRRAG